MKNIQVTSSQTLFKGRAFNLRVDEVKLADDFSMRVDVLEHTGGVAMVPLDEDGRVILVRQYRHAAGVELLELPAGTVKSGEDYAVCAERELREEIGMAAGVLFLIGEFFLAPGYSSELMRVYLATGLTPAPLPPDADERIAVERVPFDDAVRMALDGRLRDAKSVAGLLLAAHKR